MPNRRLGLLFIPLLLISACGLKAYHGVATQQQLNTHAITYLSNTVVGTNAFVLQKASIQRSQAQSFILQTEIDENKLAMAAISSIGKKFFQATLFQQKLNFDIEPLTKLALPVKELVLAYQLIFWPLTDIQNAFAQTDLHITETQQDQAFMRKISSNGRPIVDIIYSSKDPWAGTVNYRNHTQNYTLTLETLQFEPQ